MPDVLSEVLAVTRLKGTVYFSAELRAPWGIALPHRRRAPFYVVTKGRCEITLDGAPSLGVSLGPGDLVVLPGGTAHTLASSATTGTILLEQFVARFPMDERGHVNALEGKGPTPRAEERPYHKAHKTARAAERRDAAKPRRKGGEGGPERVAGRNSVVEALQAQ